MPEKNASNMLVALFQPTADDAAMTNSGEGRPPAPLEIHPLPDPSNGEIRPYLVLHSAEQSHTTLYEITAVQNELNDYHSFAVDNTIVANGTLHTISPVDPLFWLLTDENLTAGANSNSATVTDTAASTQQQQWQPLAQITKKYNSNVTRCIPAEQYQHIFAEYLVDDETFCKFSVDKAVQWLQAKQKAVEKVLLRQLERDQQLKEQHTTSNTISNGSGAFESGFNLGEEEEKSNENSTTLLNDPVAEKRAAQQRRKAIHESIQVVGNYLSVKWKARFLESLECLKSTNNGTGNDLVDVDVAEVWGEPAKPKPTMTTTTTTTIKRPRVSTDEDGAMSLPAVVTDDWNPAVVNEKEQAKTKKEQPKPITAGAKRLLKVNKKGLQKMSSFFAVKKK